MNKKKIGLGKVIRTTTFYIFVIGLAAVILLPVFFLVSLSFLSTSEAYQFPLPLLPSLKVEFKLSIRFCLLFGL